MFAETNLPTLSLKLFSSFAVAVTYEPYRGSALRLGYRGVADVFRHHNLFLSQLGIALP